MLKSFLVSLSLLALTSACIPTPAPTPQATPGASPVISLYFTDPGANLPPASDPAAALEAAVRQAQTSIDIAIYNFSLPGLEDALIDADARGVQVRMVMDSDNLDNQSPRRLAATGIPIAGDRGDGTMHNKFAVIDGGLVCTGSMNFTSASAYDDENNLACLRSPDLAAAYEDEFEEMYVNKDFGAASPEESPLPALDIGSVQVEVLFSPEDGAARRLLQLLRRAEHSIYFLAYSFTSDSLAGVILDRAADGVTVAGVMDAGQAVSNTGGEYDHFRQAGLDVRLDGGDGLLHHKVIIIDETIVAFGSYNFSASADQRNDENLLILHSPDIAAAFLANFRRIQAEAQPLP